jgi:hypothetical protein
MRKGLLGLIVVIGVLVVPSSAFGQATRTWVSGTGDDVNPCSRTAPCKTFAGAISKTATGGEINCLDSGGFGAVTITKALQIDCRGVIGGILAAGTSGVIVNAPSTARVVLRGLEINGVNQSPSPGLNGVRVLAAKTVKISNTTIRNFNQNGVDFEPTSFSRGVISNSEIFGNTGNGVLLAPTVAGTASRVTVRNSELDDNGCGVTASSLAVTNNFASNCGVATGGAAIGSAIMIDLNNQITNSAAAGVFANGADAAHRIGANEIFGNATGLVEGFGGAILSFGDNYIAGNGTDGAPTSTIPRS